MSKLTFVGDGSLDVLLKTDSIPEEWKQLILTYIIMQLAKRHRDSKMHFETTGGKTLDPNEFEDLSAGELKVIYESYKANFNFDRDTSKNFEYYLQEKKLITQCVQGGKSLYSSEISIDIVEVLVSQAKKVNQAMNSNEQEAVDDNNFLKSPNSGGAQLTYNQVQARLKHGQE